MTINYIIFTQEDVLPKPKQQQQQQQQVKQDSWGPKVGWNNIGVNLVLGIYQFINFKSILIYFYSLKHIKKKKTKQTKNKTKQNKTKLNHILYYPKVNYLAWYPCREIKSLF